MAFFGNVSDGVKGWGQSLFTVDPNATPEQLERKRQALAALMPDGRARYVGEGLADLAKGVVAGIKSRRMDKFEADKRSEASGAFGEMLNRTPEPQGPMTILGMNPDWGQATPFAEPQQQSYSIQPGAAPGEAAFSRNDLVSGLVRRGLPQHVAEGFAMNAQDESGMNPGINEAAPIVPGSRGGFGLMQWTGPRRRQLEAFASQRGGNVADPNVQMDFLMSELGGSESAAAQAIMGSGSAGEAGAAIVNKFLRPAEEHRTRREAEYLGGAAPSGAAGGFSPVQIPQYSGPPIADLQAAVNNPWLSASERQTAASMLDRAMQQSDPMQQMQLQQAALGLQKSQIELAQAGQKQTKPMEINGQLVDPMTGQVLGDYRDEAGAGGTEYGLTPQYGVDASGNPVLIQIGKDGSAVQTAMPDGVTFQKEPIRMDAGTHYVLLDPISRQPVGQVPKDLAGAEESKAIGKATGEAKGAAATGLSGAVAKADQAVALLKSIRNDPALPGITGMIQGRMQPITQAGTDLNVKIEQAKGQVFLEAFQSLKGGGAITEMEGQKAEQAIARMNRAQSVEAYQTALDEMVEVIEAGKARAMQKAGQSAPVSAPVAAPASGGGWTEVSPGIRIREKQ